MAKIKFKTKQLKSYFINPETRTREERIIEALVAVQGTADGTLEIPANIQWIENAACSQQTNVRQIILPEGLTSIKSAAFQGCTALEEINIPSSVVEIGSGAFSDCENLKKLHFPKKVIRISGYSFVSMPGDIDITFEEGSCYSFDGNAILSSTGELIRLVRDVEEYTVPESVTIIAAGAFAFKSSLKRIILPDTVEKIGEKAFADCTELEYLRLPENQPEIMDVKTSWFSHNSKLTDMVIPTSVKTIGYGVLAIPELKDVEIPSSVENLNADVFDRYGAGKNVIVHKQEHYDILHERYQSEIEDGTMNLVLS